VAELLCVAMNGYHNDECTYQWTWEQQADSCVLNGAFPIAYVVQEGVYTCRVQNNDHTGEGVFCITSELFPIPHGALWNYN